MTAHSRLPPSRAARRVACPGSRALEEKYATKEQSPAAREGEAAHWLAAQQLVSKHPICAAIAPNGEPITDEMRDGADLYSETILGIARDSHALHIEEKIDIGIIHPDCFGTPDCWFFKNLELHIFDYKFGHGYVEVFENWQMIEYAAGILDYVYRGDWPDISVTFHIVQPRSYHPLGQVRSWKTTTYGLHSYFDKLRNAEIEASQHHAITKVSPECHHCVARHACPTLRQAALTTIDTVYLNTPCELPPDSLGSELRYLMRAVDILNARIEALKEETTVLIKRGERVPYFSLEQSPPRLKWGVEVAEVLKLGELLGVNLSKPQEAITPKQAIAAGISESLIEVYCERQRGALKLTQVNGISARKIFERK